MLRFNLVLALALMACTHLAPPAPVRPPESGIKLIDHGRLPPKGTRFAIQFNDGAPVIEIAGDRGIPILYHGRELDPNEIKSIRILRTTEARAKFGDQTIAAAILIELK